MATKALKPSTLRTVPMSGGRLMRWGLLASSLTCVLAASVPARAQSNNEPGEENLQVPRIGLDIAEPGVRSAPPATPFGVAPSSSRDSVLDFHGYVLLPLNVGLLKRENPPA